MKPRKRTPKTRKLEKPKKIVEICNSESLNNGSFAEKNQKFKSVSLTPGEGSISMHWTRNKDLSRDNNVSDISFSQNSSDQETELHKVVDNIITDLVSYNDDKNVLSSRNEVEKVQPNLKKIENNTPLNSSGISCVLNGVTAFVEVRSQDENQSEAIEHKLQMLGAKISKRLNKKVTHVVFKEGKMSTRKKAVNQGIHIVSVLWVESCRQNQEKVPEYLFPSISLEDTEIPLIPRRGKKFRCMKPKNFSQEFAGSAEKLKKIFSRIKGSQGEIKSDSPISTLEHSVENAENHKPDKELCSKILQTPTKEISLSQKRKLFDDKLEAEQASVKKEVQHISKEQTQSNKKHILNKRKLYDAQQAYSCTTLESEMHVTKSVSNYENIISGKGRKNWTEAEDFNNLAVESQCEIPDSCNKLDETEKCKGKKVKKTTHSNYVHCKKRVNDVNVSENKRGCIQNGNLGKGLSYKNGFNTSENNLNKIPEHTKSYRHSIDDFKIDKKRKKVERPNEWIELSHESEKANLLPSLTTKENNNQEKNLLKNIVLTSVSASEQESIYSIVKALGGFTITDSVTQNTTHVICGDRKRTLNVLFALAQGCWLLSPKWIYKSLEAGCWLEEEAYELCDYFPAVQICRIKRTSLGTSSNLFRDIGPIYISDHSVPPRDKLAELVTIAGGKVTNCFRQCSIAVGMLQTRHADSIKVVTEKWILDCISNHKILPFTAQET